MSSPHDSESVALSVDEIAALTDTELRQFMVRNRQPDGTFELPVEGWDKLSKDERSRLAERLKDQQQCLAHSPTACSQPLDLEHLDARLQQISASEDTIERSRRSRSPTVDPAIMERQEEIEDYHKLVQDGGRPAYPIDLFDTLFEHAEDHFDALSPSESSEDHHELTHPWHPWLYGRGRSVEWSASVGPVQPGTIYGRQWIRWQDFRKWQNDNRDLEDDDGGYPAYVETRKFLADRHYRSAGKKKFLAELEADPMYLISDWNFRQDDRKRQRYYCQEFGRGDTFSGYVDAVKSRLARHGFTRLSQLKEEPKQQDKLATWIEYLNFEYWWLDRYTRSVERQKPQYEKAWQDLVDAKVLRPNETQEFIRTDAWVMLYEAEKNAALKAFKRARDRLQDAYTRTQTSPDRLLIPEKKRVSMLKSALDIFTPAQTRQEFCTRRGVLIINFVHDTDDFIRARKNIAQQKIMIQWVLDQIPLVEAELAQSQVTVEPESTNTTKRRLDSSSDGPGNAKKQKLKCGISMQCAAAGGDTEETASEKPSN
ncbi:hypothetical protein F5Y14DRAFT_436046 [Nemania sp. NC0429]|nr:hypothetical protein F5Y14DRAFT_436046 [Nemania sp. NC0429]